jgi:asparagine synthase (glutamine-hydrolysing)
MCGIAGYLCKNEQVDLLSKLQDAAQVLSRRGPDLQQCVRLSKHVAFAHARLSIIDTSAVANQPMIDSSGRYTLIFNGEIFNFRELKKQFLANVEFSSHSDTEVLLYLFIKLGKACLQHLNGFFAFAVFDNETGEIFLGRDRFGIKPLHIYADEQMVVFASELKAILRFPIKKQIDYSTLLLYLQLNYVAGPESILKNVQKLKPGHFAIIDRDGNLHTERYYTIPYQPGHRIDASGIDYDTAKQKLKHLVEEAVQRRLVSDVPLGTFLSGGIDSSIVTACASQQVKGLNSFSIGYKDEPYFDETKYANLVAKKYHTNHTVFSISNEEMFSHIFDVLEYIDEPFADSSAIAVYILSYHTRKKVTVALSGDGGDELFAGYNKHKAEMNARVHWANPVIAALKPVLSKLPQSRHSPTGNLFRQASRYAEGLRMNAPERYWRWCIVQTEKESLSLLRNKGNAAYEEIEARKRRVTVAIKEAGDINDILYADMQMLLPGDMLTKVDLMSMANSLEVRVPLLDYNVVDYAFSLPAAYKRDATGGKKILKDAFRDMLPAELFSRPKRGFEVPLLKWMQTGLRPLIENDLLRKDYLQSQGIFDSDKIESLKQKLFSTNPGDVHAVLWAIIVFQYWYKKYFA